MRAATTPGADRPTPPPTVLRGPADADHFRTQVGRYGERWYCDPLPACDMADVTDAVWPSVSTVKKASGADWSFVALKRVSEMLSARPSALDGLDDSTRYETLKTANKVGLEQAARRGTNVHLMAEARLYGTPDPVGDDEPGANYRSAVQAFFDERQPELLAAEFVVVHRDLNGKGYGGTCDALVRIDGKTYIVDWKSRGEDSSHGAYPEEAAQIAAYAHGHYMIVDGPGGARRSPLPDIDGGLIVSIKPDGYRIYPIDLGGAFDHWAALHGWWCARLDERKAIGKQWSTRVSPLAKAQQARAEAFANPPVETKPAPDEGAPGDTSSFDALEARYKALDAEHRAWIASLTQQATEAGVSFHAKNHRTARRFDIIAALVQLCSRDDADDVVVRQLLQPIVGEPALFPSVTVGALVGSLSATEAAQFAALVRGDLAILVREDGTLTLQHAA